jgi:hypothetical protein
VANGKATANISNITLYSGSNPPIVVNASLKQP